MQERTDGGIRCSEVLGALSEYVDGELPQSQSDRIEAHLLGCANCRKFGQKFGTMLDRLKPSPGIDSVSEQRVARILASVAQQCDSFDE